jgi:hypothetical protein
MPSAIRLIPRVRILQTDCQSQPERFQLTRAVLQEFLTAWLFIFILLLRTAALTLASGNLLGYLLCKLWM